MPARSSAAPDSGWSGGVQAPAPDYGSSLGASLPPPAATGGQPWWGSVPPSDGPQMRQIQESLKPVWATGLVMMATGYLYSIVVGAVSIGQCCYYPNTAWTMFIPLVGGYIWPATQMPNYSSMEELMGIPGSGVQTLGLILVLVGAIARRTRTVPARAELAPRLDAGPGELGLALTWEL